VGAATKTFGKRPTKGSAMILSALRAACPALVLALISSSASAGAGNDDCASAQAIAPGSLTTSCHDWCNQPFGACTTDYDWYRITVPAGEELVVHLRDLSFAGSPGSPFLIAHDGSGACPGPLLPSTGWLLDGAPGFTWLNATGAPRDVLLLVYVWTQGDTTDTTMFYRLETHSTPSACFAQPDDALAPNQSPGQARPTTDVVHPNLFVRYTQPDAFRVLVPAFGSFTATATFTSALGDVDLRTYDAPNGVAATGTGDVETLTWTNPHDFARLVTFYAHVKLGQHGACNTYQLAVDVASAYGTEYCPASPNSLGVGANLTLNSPPSASASSWTWWSYGTNPGSSILLYCGGLQTATPFGDGVRCVGGTLYRLRMGAAGSAGHALMILNAATLPAGLAFASGSTWNFQTRYRDLNGPLGSGFNLSNGVSVTFTP
jgi:hypothetical protein